jgi:hypothetical protein
MANKHTKQQLQEQLLAEFDAVDKFGKFVGRTVGSAAKGIGSVAGGVAGLGSAIKQGYQAGKQTVGGGGANVQTKQQPKQQGNNVTKQKTSMGDKFKGAIGKGLRNIDQVANYDYTKGTQTQQDQLAAKKTAQQQADAQGAKYQTDLAKAQGKTVGTQPGAQQAPAGQNTDPITQATNKGGTQNPAGRQKTGGKVAGQVSNTASAQAQRDRRAAKKQTPGQTATQVPGQKKPPSADGAVGATNAPKPKSGSGGSAVKQGMDQAQKPGQKAPAQVDANKDGKDDKTGKPISKTAQNVGKNAGVNTAKIGGQKVDLNDPKMKNLRNAIEKASPGTISAIDKMDAPSKAKLKKAIS